MSKTENPKPTVNQKQASTDSSIKTLEDLSVWIEAELVLLEARHEAFATKSSVRNYLQR